MNQRARDIFYEFLSRNQFLNEIRESIEAAHDLLKTCYQDGHKLLTCGNGGSAADADHIAGELIKGFRLKRALSLEEQCAYRSSFPDIPLLADRLQGGLPTISLCAHTSLMTAVINDQGADLMFAQQVHCWGEEGDVLLGISTSGNSRNIVNAARTARQKKVNTILLTGADGGKHQDLFDLVLKAPARSTSEIQDMHSVIYHALCAMIEAEFWEE